MRTRKTKPLKVVILSGGTGATADHVLQAATAQFDNQGVQISHVTGIKRIDEAVRAVKHAAAEDAVVCHTLVDPGIRDAVSVELLRLDVAAVDPLGPLISLLADHLKTTPHGLAGLAAELRDEQFDRSDAVDFTIAHDDGQRLSSIREADVVLAGVSRVSKSVTCFFLASRGIRAANVPVILTQKLPAELEEIDPSRVFGLTMNTARLCAIRQARLNRLGSWHVPDYADRQHAGAELIHARQLMEQHGWRCIDVSYRATEEVVSEIIEMLPQKNGRDHVKPATSR